VQDSKSIIFDVFAGEINAGARRVHRVANQA
jgi:hypothetical protein